jgi:hypothetical protein
MSLGPHIWRSFGRTSATKERRCRGTAEGYHRPSGPGGPAPVAWPTSIRGSRGATSPQGSAARHGAARQGVIGRCSRLSPLVEKGSVAGKTLSLGGGEKAYKRRLLPRDGKEGTVKGARSHTRESSETSAWHALPAVGSPCPALGTRMGSMRRKPTMVGKRRTSLLAPREVKTDETGRSRPISAACQSAWRTVRLAVPL